MDRNRYTWNSQIGRLSKKKFLLLSLTVCYGSMLISNNSLSLKFTESLLGFVVIAFSFQVLTWRNEIENYLLFLKGSLNTKVKETISIYGEDIDLKNYKDDNMERYLDVYGRVDTKVKKILSVFAVLIVSSLLNYMFLKSISLGFSTVVGLAVMMVSTNTFGELLIPVVIQLLLIIFQIEDFDKTMFLKLGIYLSLVFLCISSQYRLETSFYSSNKDENVFSRKIHFMKIIKSVMFLFFLIGITNHFLPGNKEWFEKFFKNKLTTVKKMNKGNSSDLIKDHSTFPEKKPEELNTHDQYMFKKNQRKDLHDLDKELKQLNDKLNYSKNLIKYISTMKGFENIDLSSYVEKYNGKHNKLQNDMKELQSEIQELKNKNNIKAKAISDLYQNLHSIGQGMDDLQEFSKQFKASDSDMKSSKGGTYKELDEMMKGMNHQYNESKESISKIMENIKNNEKSKVVPPAIQTSNTLKKEDAKDTREKPDIQTKKTLKDSAIVPPKKNEKINWKLLIRIIMIILAFILIEKIFRLFMNKEIVSKTDKRLKQAWKKNLHSLRKQNLAPEEEVIQTYHLLHTFLEQKHYAILGENAPPAFTLYIQKLQIYKNIEKQFYYITDLFMRCRYGKENVPKADLKTFRKCVSYTWKKI